MTTDTLKFVALLALFMAPAMPEGTPYSPGLLFGADDEIAAGLPPVKPASPEDSRGMLQLRDGFQAELVAAEPLVRDPVAVDFDEFGRMYVVELPPYNTYVLENSTARGSVRRLEDSDGDGVFDVSREFATGLKYPTAVACWDGGVYVGDAPDLLYLKDTDGDGIADTRHVVLTGFGSDKAGEAHLNSIRWSFDNRFHFSTSLSGGDVAAPAVERVDNKDAAETERLAPLSVRGRGIVFDPNRPADFERTSGGGQHGLSMDDWGHKFVCSNSVPAQTLMYDDRYVARNPHTDAAAPAVDIAPEGKFTKLYRISPAEPWRVLRTRLRKTGKFQGSDEGGEPFGFFTGATGITIYRGDAWPDAYRGNLIVGDVANNLVYRATLEKNDLGLIARRADADAEFLASRDIWFRPVQFANAPDGTLYVLDMYRELIEGAAFLPPEFFQHLNVAGGNDLGRIYRIAPQGFVTPQRVMPGTLTTAELVPLLDHPNGWHRDTASRLIFQRQDRSVVAAIRDVAHTGKLPQGRMTALYSLDGLDRLDEATLLAGLRDNHPEVRRQAIRIAERYLHDHPAIQSALLERTSDEEIEVRYQTSFSVGVINGPAQVSAIQSLVVSDGGNAWFRIALLASSGTRADEVFRGLTDDTHLRQSHVREFLLALAAQIGRSGRTSHISAVAQTVGQLPADSDFRQSLVKATVETLSEGDRTRFLSVAGGESAEVLNQIVAEARRLAADEAQPVDKRVDAIGSLSLASFIESRELLGELLELSQPPTVRAATLSVLGRFEDREVAEAIITAWPGLSPVLRSQALEILLSRSVWLNALLDSIDNDQISRREVDPARIALLKQHPDESVRERVAATFTEAGLQRRRAIVDMYQPALEMDGDVERGRKIFRSICAACHQLEGHGRSVGADLRGIRDRGMASVMLNVLDPNREVKPAFVNYVIVDRRGRVLLGMIGSESANSITLRRPDGTEQTVQRAEIEEMRSTEVSFMPEGLERQIDLQGMADLLEYLNVTAE